MSFKILLLTFMLFLCQTGLKVTERGEYDTPTPCTERLQLGKQGNHKRCRNEMQSCASCSR